jgi:UDP-glucose 4-epimerase
MKDSRIFITGGCGFIGANLVKYFLDKDGYDITVYDNLSTGSKENLARAVSDSKQKATFRFMEGDVLDKERLENETKGHTAIIHLAAHTNVIDSLKNPTDDFSINAVGTFNVLEAARKNNIKNFIYASSNAVVGEQNPPINEEEIPAPVSPYGASKLTGETLCSAYYHSYGIRAISLRFANCYGPYSEHKTSVVAKFIRRAKQGKPLEIYGDGNQTRDFIHAQDICDAIDLALDFDSQSVDLGLTFQIATGVTTKIIDLAKMIRDLAVKSGLNPPEIIFEEARRGEIRKNYADITKAREVLGFRPEIELGEGLKGVWHWKFTSS